MNLSRNFGFDENGQKRDHLIPGRYQNSLDRTVDVLDSEIVPDTNHPNDRTRDRRKWRGELKKSDGTTLEQTQYFTDDGSLWGINATSHPHDLKRLNYAFETDSKPEAEFERAEVPQPARRRKTA